MADTRRCRRCKRRRLDDEPFEVQQYKTCAKCRIIERAKKKSRKPLAEETMRYGLKQFHEQSQNANFIHEDIFYGEQLKKELEAYEQAAAAEGRTPSITLESANLPPTSTLLGALAASNNGANASTPMPSGVTNGNNAATPPLGSSTGTYRQSSPDLYRPPSTSQHQHSQSQFSHYQTPNGGSTGGAGAGSTSSGAGVTAAANTLPPSTQSQFYGGQQSTGSNVHYADSSSSLGYSNQSQSRAQSHSFNVRQNHHNNDRFSHQSPKFSSTAPVSSSRQHQQHQKQQQQQQKQQQHNQQQQQQQQQKPQLSSGKHPLVPPAYSEPAIPVKKFKVNAPFKCELCTTHLHKDDPINSLYRLCRNCYEDPFHSENVFGSFSEYLSHIASVEGYKDLFNLIYICEMEDNFIDGLEPSKPINNELQFRQFLSDSLKDIYLDPIIGSVNVNFSQISSNIGEFTHTGASVNEFTRSNQYKHTNPIKLYYKCDLDINGTSDCESNIYLNYNSSNNLLIIKLNHSLHYKDIDYPVEVVKSIDEVVSSHEGFRYTTDHAEAVYETLKHNGPIETATFLAHIPLRQFRRDFATFDEAIRRIKLNETRGPDNNNGDVTNGGEQAEHLMEPASQADVLADGDHHGGIHTTDSVGDEGEQQYRVAIPEGTEEEITRAVVENISQEAVQSAQHMPQFAAHDLTGGGTSGHGSESIHLQSQPAPTVSGSHGFSELAQPPSIQPDEQKQVDPVFQQ